MGQVGVRVRQESFPIATSGDNVLVTPRDNSLLRVFRVTFTVASDVTGDVTVKLGNTVLSTTKNPKAGALYGLSIEPNFAQGGPGESVTVNLPSATATGVDVTWDVVQPFGR